MSALVHRQHCGLVGQAGLEPATMEILLPSGTIFTRESSTY